MIFGLRIPCSSIFETALLFWVNRNFASSKIYEKKILQLIFLAFLQSHKRSDMNLPWIEVLQRIKLGKRISNNWASGAFQIHRRKTSSSYAEIPGRHIAGWNWHRSRQWESAYSLRWVHTFWILCASLEDPCFPFKQRKTSITLNFMDLMRMTPSIFKLFLTEISFQ